MIGYVANTDYDWYCFLRDRGPKEEVNFWQPGGKGRFPRLLAGTPFFFKLKKQRQVIAGFGYYAHHSMLPMWLAWDTFLELNGAPNFESMKRRIESLRRSIGAHGRPEDAIGCTMIVEPVFFREDEWIPGPRDWKGQTVQGKGYDLATGEGQRILEECLLRAQERGLAEPVVREREPIADGPAGERYGKPVLVRPRLGQKTFQIAVTDAYGRACAVTCEHSLPALDAAHIRPYGEGGVHSLGNGLLLRSDIHRLFDKFYVTVTPEFRFEVGRRLKLDYKNGQSYYPLDGKRIQLPSEISERPDPALLEWHNSRFLG